MDGLGFNVQLKLSTKARTHAIAGQVRALRGFSSLCVCVLYGEFPVQRTPIMFAR